MSHILFISYEINPVTPGGVGTFIASITSVLLRDGHRVSLLLDIGEEEFAAWQQYDAVAPDCRARLKSFRVHNLCETLAEQADEFPSVAHWKSFQFAHCLRVLHAQMPVDLVEFVDYCGPAYYSLLARLAEPAAFPARIAVRLHNSIEIIDRRVGNAFQSFRTYDYALERAAIALADMVLTPGMRFWRDEAESIYPLPEWRVQPSFPVRAVLPFCADPEHGRDIIFVGRVSTFKGMDRLLNAAVVAFADDTLGRLFRRFVLIGPEETVSSSLSERDIMAIAEGLPAGRVIFPGRLDEAGMLEYFAEAAVAVFPNRMESFCYAAHEAHMAGVPLILSDTPAFRDHFTDDETALFFNNTIPGLLDQLRRVLQDGKLRQRLSQSVRPHLERYQRHDYQNHLEGPRFVVPADVAPDDVSIIVVPSADDQSQAQQTGARLAAALPFATVRLLAPVEYGGRLRAFGRSWTMHTLDGVTLLPQAERLKQAAVFVASGDTLDPAFIMRAVAMLRHEPRLGAVVPGCLMQDGSRRVADIPTAIEQAACTGTPMVSAVLAVPEGASLVDLCADGSALTEIAILLRLRASGRILADDPAPALTRQSAAIADSRAESASFLRRNAWWLDRTAVADTLTRGMALADAITVVDPAATESEELRADLLASRHTDHLYLHVLSDDRSVQERGQVAVLTLRRTAGTAPVTWSEIAWTGEWATETAWDRPSGMRMAIAGSLLCRGAVDPEITLLRGPGQGCAVLLWRGRALRIRLAAEMFSAVSFRLADLFDLWPDTAANLPVIIDDSNVLNAGSLHWLASALRGGGGQPVFVLNATDAPLTQAIGCFAPASVMPPELLRSRSRLIAAFTLALACAEATSVALFGGHEWLPLIEGLMKSGRQIHVGLYLRPGIAWRSGGWEALRTIAAACTRFGDRLTLHAPPGAVHDALAILGTPVQRFGLRVPRASVIPTNSKVALVFAPAPTEVPAAGHLAAAAVNAVRQGVPIGDVYVAEAEVQIQILIESYGLGSMMRLYKGTIEAIAELTGTRFIYLAPFPDSAVMGTVLTSFAAGGLALTSAGSLEFKEADLQEIFSVTLWEDAEILATHICQLVARYDELIRRLGTISEDMAADA